MNDLLIFGVGGMGRDTLWLAQRINQVKPTWNILGFLDDSPAAQGKLINGCPVLGTMQEAVAFPDAYLVCAIGSSAVRRRLTERMKALNPNARFATLIDPDAIVADTAAIGQGVVICARNYVSVNSKIADHCLIGAGCTVGHDAVLEKYVTLYPGVNVSGNTLLHEQCEMGTGSQIIQGLSVGARTIVGAGATVVRDLPPDCTAVGVPARPIKVNQSKN